MAHPLDEYPIHQVPLSMAYPGTSDRNFYDRCIYHAHDRTGEIELITGLGVYPNLGVIDAYATVRRGDRQVAVRMSDALTDDRMSQAVGPYRLEVIDPLRSLRIVCEGGEFGLAFDLTFNAAFAPHDEPQHVKRTGPKVILDASRYCQVGSWEGTLVVEGDEYAVTPDRWIATRDRSWGIRPVGEPDPPGRTAAEPPAFGMWWLWIPLRFDDFTVVVILEEGPDGVRTMNDAVRYWADGSGRAPEQLGWPEVDIAYRSGSRWPEHATLHLVGRDRRPLTLEIEPLMGIPLNVGCGYGADPDWTHGLWKGRGHVSGSVYDHNDPTVAGRLPFTLVDHVARATLDGQQGWGIFEHGSLGRHDPSGMADFSSVAP